MSPSCTPTTRQRCGPTERFADDCIGDELTGCAGVDDGEIGVGNDEAGAATGAWAAADGCVAAAIAAAEPATIGGAAAAKAWPPEFCDADANAACGIRPGGGASAEAAHWLGGGCKLGGADANDVAGSVPCGGTIGVPLRAFDPGGYW